MLQAFVAVSTTAPMHPQILSASARKIGRNLQWTSSADHCFHVGFEKRSTSNSIIPPLSIFLLGDDAEFREIGQIDCMVNAVPIRCDLDDARLEITTSLVGLPPVFLHDDREHAAATSDLQLLTVLPGVNLDLDPGSIRELGSIGYPLEGRTLFRGVKLAPAGSVVHIGAGRETLIEPVWEPPTHESARTWDELLNRQVKAFKESVRHLDVSKSFVSLTGGLDTRTILAELALEERLRPAVTMSGPSLSLDARMAQQLCKAYGIRHEIVIMGKAFRSDLPRYVEDASRMSGGLASLNQACEVYMYKQLGNEFDARISGNLGNQVGRGGTEGFSRRGSSLDVLSESPRQHGKPSDDDHWMMDGFGADGRFRPDYLLSKEVPYTSVANYCLGSHYAIQQSPYANRKLIETLFQFPQADRQRNNAPSILRMRIQDLRHRFFGEPENRSFQRRLIKQTGGFVATYPINWGWRVAGGISLLGATVGALSAMGMAVSACRLGRTFIGRYADKVGLASLHDFRDTRRWLLEDLEEYTRDILASRDTLQNGLFDTKELDKTLDEHFSRVRDHHETVVFALDVALAQKQ